MEKGMLVRLNADHRPSQRHLKGSMGIIIDIVRGVLLQPDGNHKDICRVAWTNEHMDVGWRPCSELERIG